MAAGNFKVYGNAALELGKGNFGLSTDTYVMILLTNSYVPAQTTDTLYGDISANELPTGLGYTAGGLVLGSVSLSLLSDIVTFTSAPAIWPAFSATFRYPVIVRRAGISLLPNDLLLCYCDGTGGGSITGGGGTLTIQPNASGLFVISV